MFIALMKKEGFADDVFTLRFKFVFLFQPLLYAGFTQDSSLVVVERPWRAMLDMLPPPLYRKKYGM